MTFRIGQKVTQTKPFKWGARCGEITPQFGVVYTVRAVGLYGGEAFLLFNEIKNEPLAYPEGFLEMDFVAKYFRPVVERKTDISVFHAILRSASQKVRA